MGSLEQLLEKLSIESIRPKLDQEQIDLESLLMLNEDELKVVLDCLIITLYFLCGVACLKP